MEISELFYSFDSDWSFSEDRKKESVVDSRISHIAQEHFSAPLKAGGSVEINGGYSQDKGGYIEGKAKWEW